MNPIRPEIKKALAAKAKQDLRKEIDGIKEQVAGLQVAGTSESKSSAGDKYETQREMIKQHLDMLNGQLMRLQTMNYQLNAIPLEIRQTVQEGALMHLSIGNIWIAVSRGKTELDGGEYQLISKESPLFRALKDKRKGESVDFRGKKITITELV